MAAYKDRVKQDLDRWIASGLVDAGKRDAILATLPETRRMDAATALAWVGGVLLGLIEALGSGYIGKLTGGVLGSHYQDIFAFIVLIVMLTLRPQVRVEVGTRASASFPPC